MSRVRYFPTLVLRNSITSLALIIIWLADNINTACHSSCLSCIGATVNDCTQCKYDRELVPTTSGSNVGQCKCLSIYFEDGSGSCVPCHPQCRTCSGSSDTQCLSCEDGAVLLGSSPSRCVCNARMFMNLDTGVCLPCHSTCATCNGIYSYNCLSCDNGVTLDVINYKCYCSGGSYFDATTHSCKPCHSSCLTCDGPLPNNCLTCDEATQQYQIHGECWPICNPTCKTCTGPLDTNCKTCYDNFYLDPSGKCLVYPGFKIQSPSNPPTAVALDPVIDCDGRCANCKSISDRSLCIECSTSRNMVLTSEGTCACPSNSYYYDTAANTCKPCDSSCKTCDPSQATKCHSCSTSTLQRTVLDTSAYRCLCDFSGTKATTYISSTNQCEPCGPNGRTCFTAIDNYNSCYLSAFVSTPQTSDQCTCVDPNTVLTQTGTCSPPTPPILPPLSTSCLWKNFNKFCSTVTAPATISSSVIACMDGFYLSGQQCLPCQKYCATCSGGSTCTTFNPYVVINMINGQIQPACGSKGMFYDSIAGKCFPCTKFCTACTGPLNEQCISCFHNLVLSASKGCICPEGSYIDTSDVETVCTACSGFCAICSSEFDCTVCKATFIYSTSAKECICPFNYYLTSAYKCEPCHSKCRGCQFSPDNCLQCAPDSGTPPSCTCPSSKPWVQINGQCSSCQVICNSCPFGNRDAKECISCLPNMSRDPSTNICTCDAGYYWNGVTCVQCSSTCSKCMMVDNGLIRCTEFMTGSLIQIQPETMIYRCLESYYFRIYDQSCQSCHISCKSCVGPANNECLTCKDPTAYLKIQTAPYGICICDAFLGLDATGTCKPCHPTCMTCENFNQLNFCTWCKSTKSTDFVYGKCNCKSLYTLDSSTGICKVISCGPECLDCKPNEPNFCTSCHDFATLDAVAGRCTCQTGNGLDPKVMNGICLRCGPGCSTCDPNNRFKCYTCNADLVFDSATSTCKPAAGKYLNIMSNLAESCHTSCLTCSNGNGMRQCTSCQSGYQPWGGMCAPPNPAPNTPASYYDPATDSFIGICSFNCVRCMYKQVPSINSCTLCSSNSNLVYGLCICTNGNGLEEYGQCPTALTCDQTCAKCINQFSTKCSKCYANAYITEIGECKCIEGYYWGGVATKCTPCPDLCRTCTSLTTCDSCVDLAFLDNQSCKCQTGYVQQGKQCVEMTCHNSCKTCLSTDINQCIICRSSLQSLTSDKKCVCADKMYFDVASSACYACHPTCSACTGPSDTDCTACGLTMTLGGGKCSCNSGTFLASGYFCIPCYVECASCSGPGYYDCLTCRSNAIKQSAGNCMCVAGYAFDKDNPQKGCVPYNCHYTCAPGSCTGPAANQCLSCLSILEHVSTLGICKPPSGKYLAKDLQPYSCDTTCAECSGPSKFECTACNGDSFRSSTGECICINNQYLEAPDTRTCRSITCDPTCQTCSAQGLLGCLTCKPNAVLISTGNFGNMQLKCTCVSGYFWDSVIAQCLPCNSRCKTCSGGGENECTSCVFPAFMTSPSASACLCPSTHMYATTTSSTCIPRTCHPTCNTCFDTLDKTCISCTSPSLLSYTNRCVCPNYYFQTLPSPCQPCHISCKTCTSGSTCTTCPEFMTIYQGSCVCISGFYKSSERVCENCHPTCKTCFGPLNTNCLSCREPSALALIGGECKANSGYEISPTNGNPKSSSCSSSPSCSTCESSNPSKCLTCWEYATRTPDFTCICNPGFKQNSLGKCITIKCHPSCRQCLGFDPNQCTECYPYAQLISYPVGSCRCSAGSGTSDDGLCLPCHSTCSLCTTSKLDGCITCVSNLSKMPNGTCVCPETYFFNANLRTCESCHFTCKSCTGPSEHNCTSCKNLAELKENGSCLCRPNLIRLPGGDCSYSSCHVLCLTCTGPTAFECFTCRSNTHIPAGTSCLCRSTLGSNVAGECQQCHPTCLTCHGTLPTDCTLCTPRALYQPDGTCKCKDGYYFSFDSETCELCHYTCGTCSGKLDTQCTSCKGRNSRLSSLGRCECSSSMTVMTSQGYCSGCPISCRTCTSTGNCLSCGDRSELTSYSSCICPAGTYMDYNGDCKDCLASVCKTCNGPTRLDCLSCTDIDVSPSNGECLCKEGWYFNSRIPKGGACERCHPNLNCKSCQAPNFCKSCNTGWRLDEDRVCRREYYENNIDYKIEVMHKQIILEILPPLGVQCVDYLNRVDLSQLLLISIFNLDPMNPESVSIPQSFSSSIILATDSQIEIRRCILRYKVYDMEQREPIVVKLNLTPDISIKPTNTRPRIPNIPSPYTRILTPRMTTESNTSLNLIANTSTTTINGTSSQFYLTRSRLQSIQFTSPSSIQNSTSTLLLPAFTKNFEESSSGLAHLFSLLSLPFDVCSAFLLFVRPLTPSLRRSRRMFWLVAPMLTFRFVSLLGFSAVDFRGVVDSILLDYSSFSLRLFHIYPTSDLSSPTLQIIRPAEGINTGFYQGKYTLTKQSPYLFERLFTPSCVYLSLWLLSVAASSVVLVASKKGQDLEVKEIGKLKKNKIFIWAKEAFISARVAAALIWGPQFIYMSGQTWISFIGGKQFAASTIALVIASTIMIILVLFDIIILKFQAQFHFTKLGKGLIDFLTYPDTKGILEFEDERYLLLSNTIYEFILPTKKSPATRSKKTNKRSKDAVKQRIEEQSTSSLETAANPTIYGDTELILSLAICLSLFSTYPLTQSLLLTTPLLFYCIFSLRKLRYWLLLTKLPLSLLILYFLFFCCVGEGVSADIIGILQVILVLLYITVLICNNIWLVLAVAYCLEFRLSFNEDDVVIRTQVGELKQQNQEVPRQLGQASPSTQELFGRESKGNPDLQIEPKESTQQKPASNRRPRLEKPKPKENTRRARYPRRVAEALENMELSTHKLYA
jgi:hypothetical protein